jgi:hypothetical protein
MDPELDHKIRALSDAEALEAAQLYALEIGALPEAELDEAVRADDLLQSPQDHIPDLAQLARLLLLTGAAEDAPAARRSIDGAGQTQFILGGAEIVLLAGLLVTAYHVRVSKGKLAETTTTKTTTKPDGSVEVAVTHDVSYGISGKLASLLTKVTSH